MRVWVEYCNERYSIDTRHLPALEDDWSYRLARDAYVGNFEELCAEHQHELMKMARNSMRKQIAKQRPDRGVFGSF